MFFFSSALYVGFIVDALESRGRKSSISPKFLLRAFVTLSSNPSELLPKMIDYGSENKVVRSVSDNNMEQSSSRVFSSPSPVN